MAVMTGRRGVRIHPMREENKKSSQVRHVRIDAERAGQRLDNYLLYVFKGAPRSLVYRLLRTGQVRVNKGRVKAAYRLCEGDQVRLPPLRLPDEKDKGKVPQWQLQALESSFIFENKSLIAINKPSGMAVHGGSGISFGLIEGLRALRPNDPYLELVHRLDLETSGCLLIAKRRSMLRWLHELIRENRMDKRYLALLVGDWPLDHQKVTAPLRKNTLQSGERLVVVDEQGKASRTDFQVVRRFDRHLLVSARLHTGRTHQIRVHAAHLGTPVLGDGKYGDRQANQAARGSGLKRLFLHAQALTFDLPHDEGRLSLEAPLPHELSNYLNSFG